MGFTLSLDAKKGESGLAEIQQEGTYLRNAFFEWLAKEVPTARLTELKQSAAELEEYCANKKILSSSLFTVSDKASITRLRVRLEGDRLFKFFNRGKSERMLSVLRYYADYARMIEENNLVGSSKTTIPQPIEPPSAKRKETEPSPEAQTVPVSSLNKPVMAKLPVAQQLVMEGVTSDPVLLYAEHNGITWIDKRHQNGCLWLLGDMGLYRQINELRKMGYDFKYAKEGGKATEGRPGWFMPKSAYTSVAIPQQPVDKPQTAETAKSLSAELQALLTEDEYEPLRKCLLQQNILTVQQFENANPWVIMNRYGLYSIGQRQALYKQIMARLTPVKEVEPERLYILRTKTSTYRGNSAAEAFASFCDSIAQKYPLKIRSLLDAPYNGKGSIVLSRTPPSGEYVKIMNPIAYISGSLTVQAAVIYGQWICKMCNEPDCPVSMSEPKSIDKQGTPKDAPMLTVEQASVNFTPPKPETENPREEPKTNVEKTEQPKQPEVPNQPEHKPHIPVNARLTEKAEKIVLAADLDGISMDDLYNQLGTTMVATKQAVADSLRIVFVAGRLIHEDAFVDWEEGADQMERIIDKLLDKNSGYVSAAQLYEYVHADMQMFLNDNDMDDVRSVYDIAQHLFEKVGYHGKHLVFQSKNHISRGEAAVTTILDIMKNFARDQGGFFTEEDLEAYLKSVGVKTGNLRGQMQVYDKPIFLFYAEHTYITGESIGFTEVWFESVQKALDNLFADMGDHVILRDIQSWWYAQLPTLPGGRVWTALLLQSVLRHFSKNLKGTRTIYGLDNQAGDTLHAMIVSGTSEINTFADAVIALIVDERIEQRRFEAEELRQLLVQYGMVAGNELIWKMPKVLAKDERFAWDADEKHVTIKV